MRALQRAGLPKISGYSPRAVPTRAAAPTIDACAIVAIAAIIYASIVFPLILATCSPIDKLCVLEARLESKIFWPALSAIAIVLILRNRARLALPAHILCLLAYLAFAGATVLWAFKPELSFIRFAQQVMIVTAIVLPALLAARTTDLMRLLFLCFAFAAILNVFFVLGRPAQFVKDASVGHIGYFVGKNLLGQFAAITLLLALHEITYRGLRRASGFVIAVIAAALLILSNSKTSIGFAFVAPVLAGLLLLAHRRMRISPATILLTMVGLVVAASVMSSVSIHDVSQLLFRDRNFTGRTAIWDFALLEIARKPLFGWGYQSFWLVGPDGPSAMDAPGWVKTMPQAHSGYLDTLLELGIVGFVLLVIFIFTTIHAVGRVAQRDAARAWLLLSIALFIVLNNFLESTWMRAFDLSWVVFTLVAAEIGRYWRAQGLSAATHHIRPPRPGRPVAWRARRQPSAPKPPVTTPPVTTPQVTTPPVTA